MKTKEINKSQFTEYTDVLAESAALVLLNTDLTEHEARAEIEDTIMEFYDEIVKGELSGIIAELRKKYILKYSQE